MKFIRSVFLLGVVLLNAAFAETASVKQEDVEKNLQNSYKKCMDVASGVTSEVLDCVSVERLFHDKRLNKAYQDLLANLDDKDKHYLVDAQRKWLLFAKADTAFTFVVHGGTSASIISEDVYLKHLIKRANELEDWAASAKLNGKI